MKYKKYILSILIPFFVVYFLVSAYVLSFDLREWEKEIRGIFLTTGFIFSTAFSIVIFSIDLAKKI